MKNKGVFVLGLCLVLSFISIANVYAESYSQYFGQTVVNVDYSVPRYSWQNYRTETYTLPVETTRLFGVVSSKVRDFGNAEFYGEIRFSIDANGKHCEKIVSDNGNVYLNDYCSILFDSPLSDTADAVFKIDINRTDNHRNIELTSNISFTGYTGSAYQYCSGTPKTCSQYPNETSCNNAGCSYKLDSCFSGPAAVWFDYLNLNENYYCGFCTSASCVYGDSGDVCPACYNTYKNKNLQELKNLCRNATNCKWVGGNTQCESTQGLHPGLCTSLASKGKDVCEFNGCSFQNASCPGAEKACYEYSQQESCQSAGCNWETPPADKCEDETPINTCSATKPKYCNSTGQLINKCSECLCPSGLDCQANGSCSVTPINPEITGVNWTNMINQLITNSDLNDTVKLFALGTGFEGKEINFTIYKEVAFWFDKKMAQTSSTGFTTWRAGMKLDGSLESGTYYFKAVASDGSTGIKQSENLVVSNTVVNNPPVAVITNPKQGAIYKKNTAISFTQASYDTDDTITVSWNFGDGTSSSEYNTTHLYASDGQKNIILTVRDARGLTDSFEASISVYSEEDKKYIFADISKPSWGENITGRKVDFNANSTYAFSYNSGSISCLAGLCPSQTGEGLQVSNTPNWTGFENVEFNWTFLERGDAGKKTSKHGFGISGSVFSKLFSIPATSGNPHKALLIASINPSSTAETDFSMKFDKPYCDFTSTNVGWWEADNVEYHFTSWLDENYNCYRANVEFGMNECCPFAYGCDRDNGCFSGSSSSCEDFTTENDCNNNDNHRDIAYNQLAGITNCGSEEQYGDVCYQKTECLCQWDEEECSPVSESVIENDTSSFSFPLPDNINDICLATNPPVGGNCKFTTSFTDNCNTTGSKTVSWTAEWTGTSEKPANCIGGETVVPCLSGTLLPFFGVTGLAIAIIIIVIFYLIVISRKKKYRLKKKVKRK